MKTSHIIIIILLVVIYRLKTGKRCFLNKWFYDQSAMRDIIEYDVTPRVESDIEYDVTPRVEPDRLVFKPRVEPDRPIPDPIVEPDRHVFKPEPFSSLSRSKMSDLNLKYV